MADLPERDQALLLAARDAKQFVHEMDKARFLTSDLHQSAAIRKLEVIPSYSSDQAFPQYLGKV